MNQFIEVNDFRLNTTEFKTSPKAIDKALYAKHQNQFSALQ
jgi:hypothetical protein